MHSFLFKFTCVLSSVLVFWVLLVCDFLLGISETLLYLLLMYKFSLTWCASAANVVYRDVDIFGAKNVVFNQIL
jgi:hypothetical protein